MSVAASPTDWPMFHQDLTHTGVTSDAVTPPLDVGWSYITGARVESSPAVSGGIVYVGSDDGNVYALDAVTGAIVWGYTTDGPVRSSPAVSGGIVYVASTDHKVYALDAATGAIVWSYTTGAFVLSSPAVSGGIVYVASFDGKVYALDAATGALKAGWPYTTAGGVQSSPAVSGGIVYVGSNDDKVYALNAATGAKVWSYTTGNAVESSPAVSGGIVYVDSFDGNVYALDAVTGAKVWSYITGAPVESSPAVSGGIVYVGSDDVNVYALNAATGAFVWSYITGAPVRSSPAVSGSAVYVGSDDGKVYAFAPALVEVASATGAGTVTFTVSPSTAGGFTSLTASAVSSVSPAPPAGLTFPYGLFSFTISGLVAGATVMVTLTLPGPLPAGSFSYWKFQSGAWTQYPSASLDSTRTIITLAFTADASGTVTDPGGPAITPTATITATTATTFMPVHQTPVGGLMLPSIGFTVLVPWAIVLSLLGVLSVEAFRVKRRAKQR